MRLTLLPRPRDRRPTGRRSPSALAAVTLLLALGPCPVAARTIARIKDVVDVEDVRPNQLVGYGLVVGLAGTGDRTRNAPFTEESMLSMLERLGVNIRGTQMRTQNVAAVSVTATMPPFARAGSRIDVQVSSLGDATSLQGGTLVVTSLRGLDGQIYAVAQGPLAVSGFRAQGAAASVTRGVATSGRIAGGAIIEREVPFDLRSARQLKHALKNADFTTAYRIADAINAALPGAAAVLDSATVQVASQSAPEAAMALVARIENLPVEIDQPARVVINEASGTVVMGADVRISPVAIAQGGLTISVAETPLVSQPGPFSNGDTAVVPRTNITVSDGSGKGLAIVDGSSSLRALVSGLNRLGVSPRELISILQALRQAGALQADIEVQ
ncbi:flagellar basal body P-ring protein FlgI [Sphingomonas sp. RHCKR7]|uniref:flagellar basal body P-ring protein FlgI n=1 Tax=Sphingomonas folli TaxID=2862497 RepID=UPI001C676DC5|nr:flagellar basal body P-ring protein FlgI [Sphingomonas folli]MBW6525547.1 flagellar basal body P-ring protein FlgI [Sphingomonas folli]